METLQKIKFTESIAPDDTDKEDLPEHIQNYVKMYNESDSMEKLVILSILDHSNLTKQFIMEIFKCSKYRIDLSKRFHASRKCLVIPEKGIPNRNGLALKGDVRFRKSFFSCFVLVLRLFKGIMSQIIFSKFAVIR